MRLAALWRWFGLCLLAVLALQLFFLLRVASMALIAPESTSFERSQIWQILQRQGRLPWRQDWVDLSHISKNLQRAVIVSEDDTFSQHDGMRWDALKSAWDKNAKAQARAQRQATQRPGAPAPQAKVVGGSTISQQLAKNLFLAGERTLLRKGQEMLITLTLELCLSKARILEIYLNSVEWGEGVFGAEAAAWHYFRKPASQLGAWEAARLAVMLPRPRHFEKLPGSPYLAERAEVIVARMNSAVLP
ncbi:MAG: monofunctional biosynthetic peptidoglycan transglycosylase [Betaproteobacteria bacterium]|nr:monofunctional biosynthetic peptidoglycan transglycosylase [Betaproteobacteria bacterium]